MSTTTREATPPGVAFRLSPGFVLLIAVAAMSWAGPLIKFTTAPPQVVSAWRLIFSLVFIAVVLFFRRNATPFPRLTRTDWLLAIAAGVLLALHFWTWVASLQFTSVAASVVLVDMQPIFVAVLSGVFLRERASGLQWLGIFVACVGAVVIASGDARVGGALHGKALLGDSLALAGAIFVSGYYVIGRQLRKTLDLWIYIGIVYGIAALVLTLVVVLDPHTKMTGYPTRDWLIFLALAAGPMMLGHTGVNYALRYLRAYVANIALLGEPVGSTLIAWALPQLHEVPTQATLGGAVLIGAGILLGSAKRPGQKAQ